MSDEPEAEPLYSDDGQHVGWQLQAEDGALIGVDLQGTIVGAVDPSSGELIDHTEYAFTDTDSYDDPRADEISTRLDVLNEQLDAMNERSQHQLYIPAPDTTEELTARFERQAQDLGQLRGHPLTQGEKRALATRALTLAETGGDPDLFAAASDLQAMGRGPLIDTSTTAGKIQWASERVADETSGDDPVTGEKAWVEPRDNTASSIREARALNYLNHGVPSAEQREADEQAEYSEEDYY